MSVRLSTVRPRACSGLMYGAVPSSTPSCVPPTVIVGECAICGPLPVPPIGPGETEVEHLHAPRGRDLDVGRLEVAVHDAALVRRFERLDHLTREAHDLVDGQPAPVDGCGVARDTVGERLAFDQLQDERFDRQP